MYMMSIEEEECKIFLDIIDSNILSKIFAEKYLLVFVLLMEMEDHTVDAEVVTVGCGILEFYVGFFLFFYAEFYIEDVGMFVVVG